mmetsp:Transcript_19825/g.29467  ORF Transcript_19825/g.29467 Transcript_19825/m.29467 type:complete len:169 (-) Transcript_19825:13-519(-)
MKKEMNILVFATLAFLVLFLLSGDIVTAQQNMPLENDAELLNAMEIFMSMSGKEREEAIADLMTLVEDDPEKKAEMETLLKMLPDLGDAGDLEEMIREDEIAKAKTEAKRQLDGQSWDDFWSNQEEILHQVLVSGQLSPEDAARFATDEEAWKNQLRIIYDDLFNQGL